MVGGATRAMWTGTVAVGRLGTDERYFSFEFYYFLKNINYPSLFTKYDILTVFIFVLRHKVRNFLLNPWLVKRGSDNVMEHRSNISRGGEWGVGRDKQMDNL